jgi:anti-sigma B factor antagonist
VTEARAFNVTLTEQSEGVVVRVVGEVDIVTAPVLRRHLDSAIGSGRPTIVIDLSETTFLDARGVGVLVAARKQVAHNGGQLVIRKPPALVRRVLELAEQTERIEIEED